MKTRRFLQPVTLGLAAILTLSMAPLALAQNNTDGDDPFGEPPGQFQGAPQQQNNGAPYNGPQSFQPGGQGGQYGGGQGGQFGGGHHHHHDGGQFGGGQGGQLGNGQGGSGMLSQLNLTPAQEQKLETLRTNFEKENAPQLQKLKAKMDEFRTLRDSGKATPEQLSAMRQQLQQMHDPIQQKQQNLMKSILTPDQVQKMEAFHSGGGGFRGQGQGGWQGQHQGQGQGGWQGQQGGGFQGQGGGFHGHHGQFQNGGNPNGGFQNNGQQQYSPQPQYNPGTGSGITPLPSSQPSSF